MLKKYSFVCLTAVFFLPLIQIRFDALFAQEKKITPEQLVAAHLASIGSPKDLKGIRSRVVSGLASVKFLEGYAGNAENGGFVVASEPQKAGIRMVFSHLDYPGEYFAYDGKDVTVAQINPGKRSPLGQFVYRFNGILKEGLMGGVLSVRWPLLNLKEKDAELSYNKGTLEGHAVHVVEYRPRKSMDMRIKLFFEWESYRHVRTEYAVRQTDWTDWNPTPGAGIMNPPLDALYTLVEKFSDFKPVGALTLPHSYTIEYSAEGQGFVANWFMNAVQITNNGQVEADFFKAEK